MRKLNVFMVVLLIVVSGCNPKELQLHEYPEINEVFNQEEITDLKKIVAFFEGSICQIEGMNGVDVGNVSECYQRFFERMRESVDKGQIKIKIPYETQDQLMTELNKASYDQIWADIQVPGKEKILRILKQESKYQNFLQRLGKENQKVHNYQNHFREAGDFSPPMISELLMNYELYDVSDERIKLFVAVHYLTLNDIVRVQEVMNSK